ncbi:hypothetical protein ACIQZN_18115 [Streptomyces sp. NPDC097595]|uniref:hypothetical protein n=1 Tax=Streptomyces sp. NPDC097595 TaxID=3366090 RepID=UPI00380B1551
MPERDDNRAARRVLDEVNLAHGTRFRLLRRFDDGVQSGAWLLDGTGGQRAVLKWSPSRSWAGQIERAADAVAKVRGACYPMPEWIAVSTGTAGSATRSRRSCRGAARTGSPPKKPDRSPHTGRWRCPRLLLSRAP